MTGISWKKVDSFGGNFTSPALTFNRPCPICGFLWYRVVLEFNDFQFYTDSAEVPKRVEIRQVQCGSCFALYLNPCYSDFGFQVLFAEAGNSYGSTASRPSEQTRWLAERDLLHAGTQVLDVGCSDGRFLVSLPPYVKKVGVDVDAAAIERGRRQFAAGGIEFILEDLATFQYSDFPDIITMYHVLEHLPRPVEALRKLRLMAHGGSRLVVEVPVLEKGITNDINGFLSVQHVTHFSRRSLENCLVRAGWRILERQEQPEYNGYRVLAEPGEPVSRIAGDPKDTELLHTYLAAWHQALVSAWRRLTPVSHVREVVIWGGGLHTEFLYHTTSWFQECSDRKYIIVDSDPLKHGKTWRGIPIYPPSVLVNVDWDSAILVVSSYGSQHSIIQAAKQFGVPQRCITAIYDQVRVY